MTPGTRLERRLAATLQYGSWITAAVIATGALLRAMPGEAGARVEAAGIALLILLPVLRVAVMLESFLRTRDYRLGAAAFLVLVILTLAFVLGALANVKG